MKNILVLGSTGMLGAAVKSELQKGEDKIFFSRRGLELILNDRELVFDFERDDLKTWFNGKPKFDYVINCIGAIPQRYTNKNQDGIRRMIELNSLLPKILSTQASDIGFRIIQIATDCVFLGDSGKYTEKSVHDAKDIYGITKSLGETYSLNAMLLRCSIIGSHDDTNLSLHNWLLSHQKGSTITGYSNHFWNGITTLAFGRIVKGIIDKDLYESGLQHLVPSDEMSKYELLKIIASVNRRNDLHVVPADQKLTVDRTLATINSDRNQLLWSCGGYKKIPLISDLVSEMEI